MALLPVIDPQHQRQFPIMKARVERFQPVYLLAHGLWDARRPLLAARAAAARQEPGHALLAETAPERADGIGVRLGCMRALRGRPITKEYERANDLIAPLHGI